MKKLIITIITLGLIFSFTSFVLAKDKHFRSSKVKAAEGKKYHKRGDYSKHIRSLMARAKKIRKQLHHHFEIIKKLRAELKRIESKLKRAHHKGDKFKPPQGRRHHKRKEFEAKKHHSKGDEFRKHRDRYKEDRKHHGKGHRKRFPNK